MNATSLDERTSPSRVRHFHSFPGESYVVSDPAQAQDGLYRDYLLLSFWPNGGIENYTNDSVWSVIESGVGQIISASGASSRSGFMLDGDDPRANSFPAMYWRASRVNPPLVNGRYYRQLNIQGEDRSELKLVQFFDDDNAESRNSASLPFNIIAAGETAWPMPNDSLLSLEQSYVEVQMEQSVLDALTANSPTSESSDGDADEGSDESQVVTQPVVEVEPELPAPPEMAFGFAVAESDGSYLLNPEVVDGQTYICWRNDYTNPARHSSYLFSSMSEDRSSILLDMSVSSNGSRVSFSSRDYRHLSISSCGWVKAKLPQEPLAEESEGSIARVEMFKSQLSASVASFDEFNESLNGIAKDKDWCSEYESTITPYGMRPRVERNTEWIVIVNAEVSIEINSTSGALDDQIDSDLGLSGFSGRSLTTSGTLTVRVPVTCNEEDDAWDNVDSAMVLSAIGSVGGGASLSVDDFDHESTEEA